MKKFILTILIVALSLSLFSFTNAEGEGIDTNDPGIVVLSILPTTTPEPVYATPAPTPEPTQKPELPNYDYASEDARCISRAIWSVTPSHPTAKTKQAFAEIVQNMVDDGRYKDTVRYTFLMDTEFPSYDPEAHRSSENDSIADYVMRSWTHAKLTGDWSYRLTPSSGVRYSFYNRGGLDYIVVYDWDWNTVYDSGEGA